MKYYLNSTICALNNISKIIKTIESHDKNSTIVFQGDHGYSIYSDDNKIEIFKFSIWLNFLIVQKNSILLLEMWRQLMKYSIALEKKKSQIILATIL